MKSNTVLQVHNIGKCYTNYKHEWKRIVSWFGVKIKKKEEHWTLRNISFSIERGQATVVKTKEREHFRKSGQHKVQFMEGK